MSVRVLTGSCLATLKTLPDRSVQCCVTSPPYWNLRDYGHPDQIGQEATPQEFVASLVGVFREVWRVLADDGTLWLNIGDSFANDTFGSGGKSEKQDSNKGTVHALSEKERYRGIPQGLKRKDLCLIPARLSLALQADGWFVRNDIIWHKPNPMPESVNDRCTRSHEHIFLLTKNESYFYDSEAIKEPSSPQSLARALRGNSTSHKNLNVPGRTTHSFHAARTSGDGCEQSENRNKRDVWTVPMQPYKEAHFATFPPDLIRPCILAGTRMAGTRCDCEEVIRTPTGSGLIIDPTLQTGRSGMNRPRREGEGVRPITKREQRSDAAQIRGSIHCSEIQEMCGMAFAHYIRTDDSGARPLPDGVRQVLLQRGWITPASLCDCASFPPDTVLDPFGGSGTTGMVATELGRNAILCELNPDYVKLIESRCNVTPGFPNLA